ncbi:Long-chain fatty acid transport protein 1 [Chionoecetes opilio]|uniref:long-chain-fatty-acid--CoA ligase n=1 Tax=Chionoecetes opilio TaxID=41210 RepID=A0A8J5D0P7_CHIOP|nr:Long-chain fatty acid transport protein 1 [Chionoecetes opilio]
MDQRKGMPTSLTLMVKSEQLALCLFSSRVFIPWRFSKWTRRPGKLCGTPMACASGVSQVRLESLSGKIILNDPVRDFHGYADKSATKKKVVKDVFRKGDMAFLSGDILVMDDEGYLYFKDRTGDTFRWKGENVSTIEVENIISRVTGLSDVIVYGVEVPNCEGRAGMAVILDREDTLNIDQLYDGMAKSLASYARPLFVRTVKEIEMTGTFKLKKITVQKDGFDINLIKDRVFFLDAKKRGYVPLTPEIHNKIISGDIRL